MSFHTTSNSLENHSSTHAPPPPGWPKSKTQPKTKRSKRLFWIIGIVALLGVLITVGGIMYASNTEKLTEYEAAHEGLQEGHESAREVLETAGALEPETQESLTTELSAISQLLSAETPSVMSFQIQDRIDELEERDEQIKAPVEVLEEAIDQREAYEATVADAEGLLDTAQEVLAETEGEVADEETFETLAEQAAALEDVLGKSPEETSGASYGEHKEAIDNDIRGISSNTEAVSASHEDWIEAEERAARQDASNYETISERDWQLVERNPDAHEGESYVLYGAVTQADANMGGISIRVNTSPVQQSRRYNYDINTIVMAGDLDAFSDVVQGDHVKMLFEVTGSMTYDTTIGGSATAVMGTAYDVEVIGQF